jgi:hypothetical protein
MITYRLLGRVPQRERFHEYICSIFQHFFKQINDYQPELINDYQPEQVVVTIRFQDRCLNEAAGYCYLLDDEIQVLIARGSQGVHYTITELALHLAHELVHVWQQIESLRDHSDHCGSDQSAAESQALALEQPLLDLYWNK